MAAWQSGYSRVRRTSGARSSPGVTTLPIWIYQNLFRPTQAPIVNAVAAALIAVSIVPIYLAQRLSRVHTGLD